MRAPCVTPHTLAFRGTVLRGECTFLLLLAGLTPLNACLLERAGLAPLNALVDFMTNLRGLLTGLPLVASIPTSLGCALLTWLAFLFALPHVPLVSLETALSTSTFTFCILEAFCGTCRHTCGGHSMCMPTNLRLFRTADALLGESVMTTFPRLCTLSMLDALLRSTDAHLLVSADWSMLHTLLWK